MGTQSPSGTSVPAAPMSDQTSSLAIGSSDSNAQTANAEQPDRASRTDITSPPPSAPMPAPCKPVTRTPTPASSLASPPPTASSAPADTDMSPERIQQASPEELRSIITDLLPALQEARTSAAHFKLQYQMLSMESVEVTERMAMEMELAQREVEMQAEQHRILFERQALESKAETERELRKVHVDQYDAMLLQIQELKVKNAYLEVTATGYNKTITQQASEMASMEDRIMLLKERIKENRDHLNRYRRANSVLDTPRTGHSTPYRTPGRVVSAVRTQDQPFAALLQASDMMIQQAGTPKRKRGHAKNAHSLSSMPTTPTRSQARPASGTYHTPEQTRKAVLKTPHTAPVVRSFRAEVAAPVPRIVRDLAGGRESDGTVSASDDSEAETEVSDRETNEAEVGESQATRMAKELLKTPTRGQAKTPERTGGMLQGRLFGQVKKGIVQRGEGENQAKKRKFDESVGLGIAGMRK